MLQPKEILHEITKRPPLQREEAGKYYCGIRVSWHVQFRQAFVAGFNQNELTIHTMSGGVDILFKVDRKDYPALNLLHENENLWVEGEISGIDGSSITLTNPKLRFSEDEIVNSVPKSSNQVVKGLIIEAGGNILHSGETHASKDAFVGLRAKGDVEQTGKIKFIDAPSKGDFIERITNNQTFAIVIGTLIVLGILYIIYRYSGVNLSQFK